MNTSRTDHQTDHQTDHLRDALRRATEHIEPVGLGVEAVQRRGRGRRNRGRAAAALATATCVAAVGVVVTQHEGSKRQIAVTAQSGSGSAAPTLAFRTVAGTVSSWAAHFTTGGGVTYALSTSPAADGKTNTQDQAIYATSDGEHWTTADQHKSWIADLTERDGVLYAIGSAPGATADDVTYKLATSHDGGQAWTDASIPFDASKTHANVELLHSGSVQVARGASSTVALLTENYWPKLDALVAQRAAGRRDVSTRQTADGFAILDLSQCANAKAQPVHADGTPDLEGRVGGRCADPPTLETITWADLGLRGASDLRHQQMLVSTDGSHWDAATAPDAQFVRDLVATNAGFLMLTENNTDPVEGNYPSTTTTLLRSPDARRWTPVATPADINVQAIAGERVLAVDRSGVIQASTDGGTTWHATSVGSQLPAGAPSPEITSSDTGPLGFAVVVNSDGNLKDGTRGKDYLLFSTDGTSWSTSDLAAVGEPAGVYPQVTVGADHVSLSYEGINRTSNGTQASFTLLGTPKR